MLFWRKVEFDMLMKVDDISVVTSVTDSFSTGLLKAFEAFVVVAIFSSLGFDVAFTPVVALLTIQFRYWEGKLLEIKP